MPVAYAISWRNPFERLYDIEIRFTAPSDQPRLILPSWRPGRYLMQHYAVNVREWSGNLRKIAPSVWQADARNGEDVIVRYRYWAGVLDAGSSFLDRDEAYFNGSNLFMWIDGLREQPATLTIAALDHWKIETQLAHITDHNYEARDYDHLIDSPVIAAASMAHHTFEESGASFHLVGIGFDPARFIDSLRAIVRTQVVVFGELPLTDYKFLMHAGDTPSSLRPQRPAVGFVSLDRGEGIVLRDDAPQDERPDAGGQVHALGQATGGVRAAPSRAGDEHVARCGRKALTRARWA